MQAPPHFVAVLDGVPLLDTVTASPRRTLVAALAHVPSARPQPTLLSSPALAVASSMDTVVEGGRVTVHRILDARLELGDPIDI